ncbi:hypothetical protein SAVERM_361 [Streptomyces avermitilis MA-4680 = NBRC 14893]|uniref:Cytochrome P450 n=2 Tax=Streptomyces avermitilis TaxID=33903 RepID=Q82QY4_STRAW|nr:hypothetical protein SAVERM_361 [Streptomyces avermitilis MA-4680 = NBRC 14893]
MCAAWPPAIGNSGSPASWAASTRSSSAPRRPRRRPSPHRFVKEVLRMWSPPLILVRRARASFDLGTTRLEKAQNYLVSPHMIHRDHRYWQQPDTFDPDRFLPGVPHGPTDRSCYVPFGWAPKKCIGNDIGTTQLMGLCYLICTRYRLSVPNSDTLPMACRFAPVPQRFNGRLALAWN